MKFIVAVGLSATLSAQAERGRDAVALHDSKAAQAAGQDLKYLMSRACPQQAEAVPVAPQRGRGAPAAAPAARQAPPRDQWHAEPMKVFDNFYFLGTKEHGSWALTTSAGIIVIDALYDYAVIDEVEAGMKKLGLDPANIKYLVISHGHGDHHGGAKYLQDKYRPKVVMGPKDWDLVARDTRTPRPAKDIDATDGQKITLGDTTITLYITPGHTPTTISTVVPVKDNGVPHVAVEWGGTALSASTPVDAVQAYVESAARFKKIAADAKADVIFANHTAFDNTLVKLKALSMRKPGEPNPWVVGPTVVSRYMTVVEECGRAMLASR